MGEKYLLRPLAAGKNKTLTTKQQHCWGIRKKHNISLRFKTLTGKTLCDVTRYQWCISLSQVSDYAPFRQLISTALEPRTETWRECGSFNRALVELVTWCWWKGRSLSYGYHYFVIILVYWVPQWLKTWPQWDCVSLSQTTATEANKFTILTASS